ncbi:MAG: lysophospholipid acyltransferase family protein [Phycisphaerales bacterium]|nr:lysophospholipid acyltransferase family protein [Phycisphaerales bacterium]
MGKLMIQPAPTQMDAVGIEPLTPRTALESPAARDEVRPGERRVSTFSRLKFEFVRGFLWAIARGFSLRGLYLFGTFFGTLEYLVNFKRRARYRGELRKLFSEGRLTPSREKRIIRSYFCRTRCDKLFYLIFDKLPKEKILHRVRFHGRENLDAALLRERGVFVMLSHVGSHHVAALLMALLGYKCAGVRDRNEGPLRRFIQDKYLKTFPEYASMRMLYADSFPRDIFRCFNENRVVGAALDVGRFRGSTLRSVPVRIFGETREFLTGTLQVALRCRATICPAFVVSRPNFYFRLIVHPPIYSPPADQQPIENQELIAELMQKYADGIEQHVREHPDHLSRA